MIGAIKRMLRKQKYGEEIIVVSGLPRSGTSMMMKMLEAAKMDLVLDNFRKADDDNPHGYFEDERVKDLENHPDRDRSWLQGCRGKVIKIVSFYLPRLPEENFYKIVFMRRHLDEVIASQNKMIERRGESENDTTADEKMKENYAKHLKKIEVFEFRKPNVEVLEVDHRDCIEKPLEVATRVCEFIGKGDPQAMAAVVDPGLHRNVAK